MLRAFFISLSKAEWAQRIVTRWKFAWGMASRFIAGEKIDDALRAVKTLNDQGLMATLDHLGENTENREAAEQSTREILEILDAIHGSGLRSNVSIKLSQLGLLLDQNLAYTNLCTILQRAQSYGNFVRVDMEDSSLTQQTLDVVSRAHQAGYINSGSVIQSYLYRSLADTQKLASENIRVRMVKGAYNEPASVAYLHKKDVDTAYDQLVEVLLKAEASASSGDLVEDGLFPPLTAVGSHDPARIDHAKKLVATMGLPKATVEFQMLYGIRRDLQQDLVKAGYPVRVYVPFGTHWYPYFMRRLAERPANIWFFLSSFFRK